MELLKAVVSKGWTADGVGRPRAFQLCALPMKIGASMRWRICFWVSTAPAALLAILMEFCAESAQWLFKKGRFSVTVAKLENLFGATTVKSSMAKPTKSEKGDKFDNVKISE